MQVYHGSPYNFSKFDLSHVRSENGTSEGVGLYFTTYKPIAKGYAQNGYLYTVLINGNKQLSSTKKTISITELKKIIKKLEAENIDILSNWGDVSYSSFNSVLIESASSILEDAENDIDILCELYNESGNNESVFHIFNQLGYTHYTVVPEWRADVQKIVVVIDPSAIQIVNIEKV